MILSIGAEVIIRPKPNTGPPEKWMDGMKAIVVGYEETPPSSITRLRLELPGDVMFKWPLFSRGKWR